MSASTAAISGIPFRKINIDQYDEDLVLASSLYQPDPRPSPQVLTDAQSKDRQVRQSLQSGDVASALKLCLVEGEYPYGEDSDPQIKQAKVRDPSSCRLLCTSVLSEWGTHRLSHPACCLSQDVALSSVLSVINSSRSTDIPNLVQSLSPSEQVRIHLSPQPEAAPDA